MYSPKAEIAASGKHSEVGSVRDSLLSFFGRLMAGAPTFSQLMRPLRSLLVSPRCYDRGYRLSPRLQVVRPFLLADIGEGITECQLVQWFVKPGARVKQFDKLCEVQSDKASVEVTSPFYGIIKKLHYGTDDMAVTGQPLVDIEILDHCNTADCLDTSLAAMNATENVDCKGADVTTSQGPKDPHSEVEYRIAPGTVGRQSDQTLATPAVRHLLRRHDLQASSLRGSGKQGRLTKADVLESLSITPHKDKGQAGTISNEAMLVSSQSSESARKVGLSSIQMQMFKSMSRTVQIPHFLYTTSADTTTISRIRNKYNASCEPRDRITQLAIVLKATSVSLLEYPILNASLAFDNKDKPELIYHPSHNFGIAIDSPNGLLVPVIRDVQRLNILQIARQLKDLSGRARARQLVPRDFHGATFTVSNIGSIGGGVVAPTISDPQVAVLGIGKTRTIPAFDDTGKVRPVEELPLSWSADHRIINGAECARCAEHLVQCLQNADLLSLKMQ